MSQLYRFSRVLNTMRLLTNHENVPMCGHVTMGQGSWNPRIPKVKWTKYAVFGLISRLCRFSRVLNTMHLLPNHKSELMSDYVTMGQGLWNPRVPTEKSTKYSIHSSCFQELYAFECACYLDSVFTAKHKPKLRLMT